MTAWQNVHVGVEDDGLKIEGLDVWRHDWRWSNEAPLDLPHPSYQNQLHRYRICEIGSSEHPIRFAAAELSNGVWGFYVPKKVENG
jgi:hypothetical protein